MSSHKPITALHFTYDLSFYGGGHRRLQILADYTDPTECRIVLSSLTDTKGFKLRNKESQVLVYAFHMGKSFFIHKVKALYSFTQSQGVDIIHAYGTMCQAVAAIVGMLTRIPVVAWEIGVPKYGKLTSKLADSIIEFFVLERVCNSCATMKARQASLLRTHSNWSVLMPGVDDRDCFSGKARSTQRRKIRNQLGLSGEDVALCTIGGFIYLRDHVTTIRVAAKLRHNGFPVKLVLIGEGPIRNEVEKLVTEEGIADHVLFLGYVNNAAELLPAMDIYINGAYQEGFGFATVEAMLAGLPVIAANAGANPEVVEHERTGLLVKAKSVDDLVSALLRILEVRNLKTKLSKAARETALVKFSPGGFIQGHLTIYRKHLVRLNS